MAGGIKVTVEGLAMAATLGLIAVKPPEESAPTAMGSSAEVQATAPVVSQPPVAAPPPDPMSGQGARTDRNAHVGRYRALHSVGEAEAHCPGLSRVEGAGPEPGGGDGRKGSAWEALQLQTETQIKATVATIQALNDRLALTAQEGEFLEHQIKAVANEFDQKLEALSEQVKALEERPAADANVALFQQLVERLGTAKPVAPEAAPPATPLLLVQSQAACQSVPSERALVEEMARRLNDTGYRLDVKEVANLYTCIKAGRLTILAGPPGSGKSSMVRQFAEVMGHRSTLAEIPVRRGWTDDQQFMGAINRLHQRYEPAPTGVVPHLLAAQQDSELGLYWFLLDEFNLSTPEYYFAEFISVLEDQRPRVSLYTSGVTVLNAEEYPATIPVGENVHFFATVNLDDTASPLSPRLIDRANLLWVERQVTPEMLKSVQLQAGRVGPISAAELRSKYVRQPEFAGMTRTWWDQVHQILSSRKEDLGTPHLVSPRGMMGLASYLANAPQGALDQKDAFDFGLAQRVLPGLRGYGSGYGRRLQRLYEFAAGLRLTQSASLLERILQNGNSRGHEYDFFSCLW
jgi:energy-coupling factor transporter ATP-binding protein EcfA2